MPTALSVPVGSDLSIPLPHTPSLSSSSTSASSPGLDALEDPLLASSKKKKKKRQKKSAKIKADADLKAKQDEHAKRDKPPVLCISRNKHWKYISSYHGPWLQLPLELLESLLVLNLDPATLSSNDTRLPTLQSLPLTVNRIRERNFTYDDADSLRNPHGTFALPPPFPMPAPGKAHPPPVDPGVFRSVVSIRRLIDEAAELSVRATSGLSAVALGSLRSNSGSSVNNSPWATAQNYGFNGLGDQGGGGGGGRNITMSANRVHRLRVLAVQKLAAAYRADEIASSVMVMQGGSVFDDIAEKVLRVDPTNVDARYVHFFHEKIPSRQLAESTTTEPLDALIATDPQRLEFYRTRGIVHCFRDEYPLAVRDFTHALKETRALRRARTAHTPFTSAEPRTKTKKRKAKTNGQAPPSGTAAIFEGPDGEQLLLHPSVLPHAPDPIEPQLLFHRGAAYLANALFLVEEEVYKLEAIQKVPVSDGAEMRLCYIENGKYGGTEIGNPDGPLGRKDGAKLLAYRGVLAADPLREQICSFLKKSIRDHEKFLSHFDTLESPGSESDGDIASRTERAFILSESLRPGSQSSSYAQNNNNANILLSHTPLSFTTYHPLLVESHFSILICQLLLGDFRLLLPTFARTADLVAGLEGYPVFLPPRSMAQAEFVETLERLAGGWQAGTRPHSLARRMLAIEGAPVPHHKAPMTVPPSPIVVSASPSVSDDEAVFGGASTSASACAGPSSGGSKSPSPSRRGSPDGTSTSASASAGSHANGSGHPNGHGQHAAVVAFKGRVDAAEALDYARILLAPVVKRQRERAEKAAADKGLDKKPTSINIPLHGPRVEILLAWCGAVHLPELEGTA